MSEIKSSVSIVNSYVPEIKTANNEMKNADIHITEDMITNLTVNGNSRALNQLSGKAVNSLSVQITKDCERITSIAELFEEKDKALSGKSKLKKR